MTKAKNKTFFLKTFLFFCLLFTFSFPVFALTPDDPFLDEQWYMQSIDAPLAWENSTGTKDIVVAVLDTGVDLDHPDLKKNIWRNSDEKSGDGIDNDQNGFIDDVNGYDFIDEDGSPIPDFTKEFDADAVSHGTIIAGIIGAVGDNATGIAGVNWNVKIMSVRILDNSGIGNSHSAAQGVEYATANGADIINLSFTGTEFDDALRQAVKKAYEAGIVVVAAIGNTQGGGIDTDVSPIYPACYGEAEDEDWILGVAATTQEDTKADFSNYGSTCTDISAPGENIFSTVYQDDDIASLAEGFYQEGWSGTSMASPMVAGAAALLKSAYPSLIPKEIKKILRLSADPISFSGQAVGEMGAGRLNIANALSVAPSFASVSDDVSASSVNDVSSFRIAVAPENGGPPTVRIFNNSGSALLASFDAYDSTFSGGVRLAMGDVDGDGAEEIVTVPAKGKAQVRIFDLAGKLENQFFAFDESVQSGFFIATGDTDNDGKEEIAVSTDMGGGSRIELLSNEGVFLRETLFPFADIGDSASVRVALGDVDGDSKDEIITTLGSGQKPLIRVHKVDGTFVSEFFAYAQTYDKGVFVASGDLDGDGDDEIVTGTDNGGGPQVQIFDGQGKWLGTFFAYDSLFRGGVRLSVGNLSSWPGASIITAAGPGGGPHIRVYNGYAKLIGTFFSDDAADRDGINSAAWGL